MEEYEYDVEGLLAAIEEYLGFIGPDVDVWEMDSSRTGAPTKTVSLESVTVSLYIHPFLGEMPRIGGSRETELWAVDAHFGEGDTEEIGDYRRLIDALAAAAGPLATAHVKEEYADSPYGHGELAVAVYPGSDYPGAG
jgi:hypothetical protein